MAKLLIPAHNANEWHEDFTAFAPALGNPVGIGEVGHMGERKSVDLYLSWVEGHLPP